jgi:hypothetical protein
MPLDASGARASTQGHWLLLLLMATLSSSPSSGHQNVLNIIEVDGRCDLTPPPSRQQVGASAPVELEDTGLLLTPPEVGTAAITTGSNSAQAADSPSVNTSAVGTSGAGKSVHKVPSARGRHERTSSMEKRKSWKPHMMEHMAAVADGKLIAGIHCSNGCKNSRQCRKNLTMRIAEECAQLSFGEPALRCDWTACKPNHKAVEDWFEIVKHFRVKDNDGNVTSIAFMVDGHPVCMGTWAALYGVPPSTASTIERRVKAGEEVWNDKTLKDASLARRSLLGSLETAARGWWQLRLQYYEIRVSSRMIAYPADLCMADMYDNEFVPEMQLYGLEWKPYASAANRDECGQCHEDEGDRAAKLDGKVRGSRSTWYRGRDRALQDLAHEMIDSEAKPFMFKSRKKHSAYVSGRSSGNHQVGYTLSVI